jgi:hypothetical protein
VPLVYEDSDVANAETAAAGKIKDFKAYVNFCRREAPKAIRQALETDLDREFGIIEERMKSRLARVVETSLLNLLTTYQSIKPPEEVATMPDPNSSVARDVSDSLRSPSPSPNPVLQHDVASLIYNFIPEDIDFAADLDFDGLYPENSFQQDVQASLCHQSFDADSGYRTYSDGSNGSGPTGLLTSQAYQTRSSHRY